MNQLAAECNKYFACFLNNPKLKPVLRFDIFIFNNDASVIKFWKKQKKSMAIKVKGRI